MADTGERIAVLEEKHRSMKEELGHINVGIESLQSDMSDIKSALSRQRGFWAGVTFLASIVGYATSQFWQYLKGGA